MSRKKVDNFYDDKLMNWLVAVLAGLVFVIFGALFYMAFTSYPY